MLFCSQQFILFFLGVFTAYWLLPTQQLRVWLLLVASFFFYRSWSETLVWLIVCTSTLDYLIARLLDVTTRPYVRRLLVTVTVCSNLGMLCYFKYANFFLASLRDGLHAAGVSSSFPVLAVVLPVGISFYTFEAISYVVDVYRGKIQAECNLVHFLVFILFFPHLIAGPIVRGSDFLPQLRNQRRWSWPRAHLGLQLFLLGMFKKLAIGDRMALLADPVFADPGAFRPYVLWIALFAYAVQIYCDFSGYTDMALGCAQLLGYRLSQNFYLPYLAPNIAEFWRRWHMSFSYWLRDYLFIPMGGSKGSSLRTYRNLIVVMVMGGLWHGAGLTFIVFGLVHGGWLCLHRVFRAWAQLRPRVDTALKTFAGTCCRIALTFVVFSLTLILFRAASLSLAADYLGRMFSFVNAGRGEPFNLTNIVLLAALVAVGHLLAARERWWRLLESVPPVVRGAAYAGLTTVALVLAPGAGKTFIYFQF